MACWNESGERRRKGNMRRRDALWGRLQRKPDEDGGGERQRGCKEIES